MLPDGGVDAASVVPNSDQEPPGFLLQKNADPRRLPFGPAAA